MSTTDDHPPVQDWATDFDHTDEAYAADPFPIWDEIRASGCPVAHTERYGGAWLPTTPRRRRRRSPTTPSASRRAAS